MAFTFLKNLSITQKEVERGRQDSSTGNGIPAHLSSTLGTHTEEKKSQLPQMISDFHTQVMVLHPHTYAHKHACMYTQK